MSDLASLRQEYTLHSLDTTEVDADPFRLFHLWFAEAKAAEIQEPNAMILATAGADGQPGCRTLLLKGLDARGFTFFTNYASRKGRELEENPRAAMTFLWKELQRQVQIRGHIEKTTRQESADYFSVRPYGSQIGAHASLQSSVIASRALLEERFAEMKERYPAGSVPLPDTWGGYRLLPTVIEFWQGRPSRLHDRIVYTLEEGVWRIERLCP
jgi:pyridoxamine 5'-phosphate oxidase